MLKRVILKELSDACLRIHIARTNRALARCLCVKKTKKSNKVIQEALLAELRPVNGQRGPSMSFTASPAPVPVPTPVPVPVPTPVPTPVPVPGPVRPTGTAVPPTPIPPIPRSVTRGQTPRPRRVTRYPPTPQSQRLTRRRGPVTPGQRASLYRAATHGPGWPHQTPSGASNAPSLPPTPAQRPVYVPPLPQFGEPPALEPGTEMSSLLHSEGGPVQIEPQPGQGEWPLDIRSESTQYRFDAANPPDQGALAPSKNIIPNLPAVAPEQGSPLLLINAPGSHIRRTETATHRYYWQWHTSQYKWLPRANRHRVAKAGFGGR